MFEELLAALGSRARNAIVAEGGLAPLVRCLHTSLLLCCRSVQRSMRPQQQVPFAGLSAPCRKHTLAAPPVSEGGTGRSPVACFTFLLHTFRSLTPAPRLS